MEERGNRKSRVGVVVSNKMTKTVVVKVERRVVRRREHSPHDLSGSPLC